ncbi:MAG: hypothetical protein KBA30_02195 [Clostridia bacterium]|nr:hypothetical protein [Clostridia bacterium]
MTDRIIRRRPVARAARRLSAAIALSALVLSVCGCARTTTVPSVTTTGIEAPTATLAPVSGELRLWVEPFAAGADPLRDGNRTHIALYRLVYNGLFRMSGDLSPEADLCDGWSVSPDGRSLLVSLDDGRFFHDGSEVDAEDVVASYNAVIAAGDASPYGDDLACFSEAVAVDTMTVRFRLVRQDVFACHSLIFPILPSEVAGQAGDGSFPPGTGTYAFSSGSGDGEIRLEARDSGEGACLIRSIRAVVLPDIRQALEALEDDRIDLVDLNRDEYALYRYRQDLAVYGYAGADFLFFTLQAGSGKALSSADSFLFVRSLLDGIRSTAGMSEWNIVPAALPAPSWSQVLAGGASETPPAALPSPGYQWPEGQAVTLLYPAEDPVRTQVALYAGQVLAAAGIRVVPVGADPAAFSARLSSGAFDIALCEATTWSVPDPVWLYLESPLRSLPGADTLPRASALAEEYGTATASLAALAGNRPDFADWTAFRQSLLDCASTGPYVGIGFAEQGLIAGSRIKGQFSSTRDNPYNGIREVWVWSGS